MSETPLAENKTISNDSGLTATHAYSPNSNFPPLKSESSNPADSIEKILSSSIQRAKQKISNLEGKQREQRSESRQRMGSKQILGQSNTNAIAAAMKVLQSRVYELERVIQGLEREKTLILKELDNVTSEKKIILNNLEEANRKITQIEHICKSNKTQIKDLNKKLQQAQSQVSEWEGKCQGFEMTIRHLENDKQHMSNSLSRRQLQSSKRQSPSHKQLILRTTELEEKEKLMVEKEKKIQEKQRKLAVIQNNLREKQAKINYDNSRANELINENSMLRKQLNQIKTDFSQHQENQDKQNYETYLKKINDMEMEIEMLRETTRHLEVEPQNGNGEIDAIKDQLRQVRDKYEEVLHLYRRSQDKGKRDQKQAKMQKERGREVQDLLKQIIEKIAKLPHSVKDLKYLSVKANKVIANNVERIINLKTPTKSRSNSLNRSLSRSNSQRKNTQTSQLDNSRSSNKANRSGSKSKRKQEGSATKTKRVVVSQTGWEIIDKQIVDLKKEYKRLVKQLNQTQSEQVRNKLNDLAFVIQEKCERSTLLKQNRK